MRRYDRIGRSYWEAWVGEAVGLEQKPAAIGGLAATRTRETLSAPTSPGMGDEDDDAQ